MNGLAFDPTIGVFCSLYPVDQQALLYQITLWCSPTQRCYAATMHGAYSIATASWTAPWALSANLGICCKPDCLHCSLKRCSKAPSALNPTGRSVFFQSNLAIQDLPPSIGALLKTGHPDALERLPGQGALAYCKQPMAGVHHSTIGKPCWKTSMTGKQTARPD
ncbi:hypothetical protein [Pseudomonas sp. Fl4BN1]|uniref:hypothetical protein n=1 Tax=Pseudomonas sp. Fl4BN1 TaxID=2697651 RepID=UPI001377D588|nr:hypothetical protein [Pseudomonas sp. Fl4BN1]NBF12144.1 hypothetical protein [Pseudomonas sp. Fl4BN1]